MLHFLREALFRALTNIMYKTVNHGAHNYLWVMNLNEKSIDEILCLLVFVWNSRSDRQVHIQRGGKTVACNNILKLGEVGVWGYNICSPLKLWDTWDHIWWLLRSHSSAQHNYKHYDRQLEISSRESPSPPYPNKSRDRYENTDKSSIIPGHWQ